MDFVILDVDEDVETSLILGRSFLNTSEALINWRDGKMTLMVGDEEVVYALQSTTKYSMPHDDERYFAHETNLLMFNFVQDVLMVDPLQEHFGEELAEELMQPLIPHFTQTKKQGE